MGKNNNNDRTVSGYWESIKQSLGIKPSVVQGQFTAQTEFYTWKLINIVKGIFEVECDDNIDKDYVLDNLIIPGYFIVTDTKVGVVPLRASLTGYNVFNRPTKAVYANAVIGSGERTLGEDAVLISIHGSGFRRGIMPTIYNYAQKLASCDAAIDVNLINSKTAHVFGAKNKKEADSLKKMYDEISEGKPAVFTQENLANSSGTAFFKTDVKQNFIADMVQIEKRKIMEEFLTEIGINNANTDKRERLNADEVNSNNLELLADTQYWYNNIKDGCDKVHKMFPDFKFDIKMPYREIEYEKLYSNEIETSSEPEQKNSNGFYKPQFLGEVMKDIRSMFRLYAFTQGVFDDDTVILRDYVLDERLDRNVLNDKILLDIGERYSYWSHTELLKRNIDNWFLAHADNISKLIDSTEYKYDAMHLSEEFYEDFDENKNKLRTDNLKEVTGSEVGSTNATTDIQEISAYDSPNYQPQNKTTSSSSASTESEVETNNTGTVANTEDNENKLHHYGSKTNPDYADNVKKERALALFNVYEWITDSLAEDICLGVY